MRAVYAPLGSRVTVEPLLFSEAELDAEAFLSMMAVDSSETAPLYVQIILVSGVSFYGLLLTLTPRQVDSSRLRRKLHLW